MRKSYIYDNGHYEYKPFHWYNIALRGEFFIPPKNWVQSYIVLGVALKDEEDWAIHWVSEEDISYKLEQL